MKVNHEAQGERSEIESQSTRPSEEADAARKWYVGTMNDGFFGNYLLDAGCVSGYFTASCQVLSLNA
jgi:hypothetical protein